jgi:uncharacterized protein (TIRG00374 family)
MKKKSGLLRIALSLVIIAGLVRFAMTVNWHSTWHTITAADRMILLAAAAVNLLSLAIKAVRWWVFLRPVGANSLGLALKATFAGAGLNNILVANGGEAARVIFVARAAHVQSAKVLATLALERFFELIGYIVLLALSVSFLDLPASLTRWKPVAWAALVGVIALMVFLVRRPERAEAVAAVTVVGWRARFTAYMKHFMHTIGGISTGPRFIVALVLSVGVWAMQVWTYSLTAHAAHFNLPMVGTVAAILLVNLGFAARLTPGNVGLFQGMYALAAAGFGLDKNEAIAVAFLIQAQQIIPVTLLGVALAPEFIFRRKKAVRREDTGLDLHDRADVARVNRDLPAE